MRVSRSSVVALCAALAWVPIAFVVGYSCNASAELDAPTGGAAGLTPATADTTYLRLDTTNDPITGDLATSVGDFSSTVATGGVAFDFAPVASFTTGNLLRIGGTAANQDRIVHNAGTSGGQLVLQEAGSDRLRLGENVVYINNNVASTSVQFGTLNNTGPHNLRVYSGADASGESGVTLGTSSTNTDADLAAFAQSANATGASVVVRARVTGLGGYIPGSSVSTTPSLPTCSSSIAFAMMGYDDTDDAQNATICGCVADSAGVYAWARMTGAGTCP